MYSIVIVKDYPSVFQKLKYIYYCQKLILYFNIKQYLYKLKYMFIFLRFLEIEPIIIGMDTDDVQQRSRFIWTNITILNKDIRQLTNQNIYLHEIPKSIGRRSKKDKHNIGIKNNNVL